MKEIKLSQGKVALVDDIDSDLDKVFWHAYSHVRRGKRVYYAKHNVQLHNKRTAVNMHRVILERILGRKLDPDEFVDHINHDSLDNRRENLRLATNSENQHNQLPGRAYKTSSRYKGVSWVKSISKWLSYIRVDMKQETIGYFADELDAAKAYDQRAKELFGLYAALNFPSEVEWE